MWYCQNIKDKFAFEVVINDFRNGNEINIFNDMILIFLKEMRETHRFETLVSFFTNPQEFQIEFMVACMQFINIVVHSVEVMMNTRFSSP